MVIEEHIVLIEEPDTRYLGHVTPSSGSASDISTAIINFFIEKQISIDSLVAVGCDGTATNTGNLNAKLTK